MPLNVMDAHFNSFEMKVLPVLVKSEIGVLGMSPWVTTLFSRADSHSRGVPSLCYESSD